MGQVLKPRSGLEWVGRRFRDEKALLLLRLRSARRNLAPIAFQIGNWLLGTKPIRVHFEGGVKVRLVPQGAVALGIWAKTEFERREIEFLLRALQPGMTFFDVGANVGLFSIAACQGVHEARIFAFEPCSWTFQVLQENIRLNRVTRIAAFRTALGRHIGSAVCQVNGPFRDGLNTLGEATHPACKVVRKEVVPITTLDSFMTTYNIDSIHLMKVDTEGSELFVFQGANRLLQRNDAPLILYESFSACTQGFGYQPVLIMQYLCNYGYRLFTFDSNTGQVTPTSSHHSYEGTVVAAKPSHFFFQDFNPRPHIEGLCPDQ